MEPLGKPHSAISHYRLGGGPDEAQPGRGYTPKRLAVKYHAGSLGFSSLPQLLTAKIEARLVDCKHPISETSET